MKYIDHKPIYLQIAYDIVLKLYQEILPKASLLPSVRELSVTYEVTPKTIQSVTKYLSEKNIITIKAGVGSVITNNDDIIKKVHQLHATELAKEFIASMKQLHINNHDILTLINVSLKEETK